MDLTRTLPDLLPGAVAWAEAVSEGVLRAGRIPGPALLAIAGGVGVAHPPLIRVLEVSRMPMPDDPRLRQAALTLGLLGAGTLGLTLDYAVLVGSGHGEDSRLLSHEFRHVFQYEQAGSIAAFLQVYLLQIAAVGYERAPFEVDARAHELPAA